MSGKKKSGVAKQLDKLVVIFELEYQRTKFRRQLSYVQQQRVVIARAVINNAKLIVADELTDNLDSNSSNTVPEMLSRINQRFETTVIYVTQFGFNSLW